MSALRWTGKHRNRPEERPTIVPIYFYIKERCFHLALADNTTRITFESAHNIHNHFYLVKYENTKIFKKKRKEAVSYGIYD